METSTHHHLRFMRSKQRVVRFLRMLNRHGISRRKLRKNRYTRIIGEKFLQRDLWTFERDSLARAWVIGILVAFSPFFGLHMLLAFLLLIVFRANVPFGVALVFITNPFTVIPFYSFAYWLGSILHPSHAIHPNHLHTILNEGIMSFLMSPKTLWHDFWNFFLTLTLGCTVIGTVMSTIGYAAIKFTVKNHHLHRNR